MKINRLRNNRCYLAGAMEKDATNGVEWRQAIQESLADLQVCWLDPTHKPTEIGRETIETKVALIQAREAHDYEAVRNIMKTIRCVDLRMTDISDFLIVNLDPTIPTFGTHEEIANANRQKKPIIVHLIGGKEATPLWLLAMLPHQLIFSTWEEIHHYLRHVAYDPVIDRLNRWYFFKLTHHEA
jgi:nucleoside 2-deoxyribosyltransferase